MSNKIVKIKFTPKNAGEKEFGVPVLYHFEIDRSFYDTFDQEMITNPKNRKMNFVLSSFAGLCSTYTPPKIVDGVVKSAEKWTEEPMSKDTFHALIQTPEWGCLVGVTVMQLLNHYGGEWIVEDFLE